ncbi:MAG: thymidylate synthase [Eubacteriales bacterium]|nr:thymidylate synthase [Eubacteriales bacterium]
MSHADQLFKETCRQVLQSGMRQAPPLNVRPRWDDGEPAYTIRSFGIVNRYDLSKGFPILTIRKFNYKKAIDEILWIWQKKSNRLSELDSKVWDAWAKEDGTIGKAYGYQLGQEYQFPEGKKDQVDHLLWQLKNDPESRRMICHMYNFSDLHEMALYPCAYSLSLSVIDGKLNGILNQRSQDLLAASCWNVVQYAALLMAFAQVSELEVGELVHVIVDAHIYDRHEAIVRELLERPEYPAPVLKLDPSIKNFYDFTVDSFTLENYQSGPGIPRFPVAI